MGDRQVIGVRRWGAAGKAIGVDPGISRVVYFDRDVVRSWERAALTRHPDGHFDVLFVAANVQLSMCIEGQLETRPAGTFGDCEQWYATEQPAPQGTAWLYRARPDGTPMEPVLWIEEAT